MHPETLEEDHELGATTDSHSLISRDQDDRFAMDGRKFLSPVHLGKSFAAESEIDASYPDGMFSQSKTQVFLKKRTGSITSMSLNQQAFDSFQPPATNRESVYSMQNDKFEV